MNREYIAPYKTTDLYTASFLKAVGIPLTGLTKQGSRVTFEFDEPERCRTFVLAFLNETDDEIQASVFSQSLRQMKILAARGEL